MTNGVYNFAAGPAVLPLPVLERARDEMLDYAGNGLSVLEMSHRSRQFEAILERAEAGLRQHLAIPDDYAVLFLQGGASLQFAMIPMNLYVEGRPVDVIHTGAWTGKAIEELEKLAPYRVIASTEAEKFRRLPRLDEIVVHDDASYVYMASNNTIYGTQWRVFPDTGAVPLVADMSSDILSRAIDVARFGLIFAGAQKNLGPAGLTIVIVRKDLVERGSERLPAMLQYRTHVKHRSLYNTPPCFAIYIMGLVMDWIAAEGGLAVIERRNDAKAQLLYDAIDSSGLFYCPVEKESRSRMNVIFRVRGDNVELEDRFVKEARAAGLIELKGHRSVGGLRASIYNAQPIAGVQALVDFMQEFESRYG